LYPESIIGHLISYQFEESLSEPRHIWDSQPSHLAQPLIKLIRKSLIRVVANAR